MLGLFSLCVLAAGCAGLLHTLARLMREGRKLRQSMPQMQGGGILGWWPEFARPDRHRVVAEWTRRNGCVFFYRMFFHHGVIITDPHMASDLLMGTGKDDLDKSDVVKNLDLVLNGSGHSGMLTSSTNDHWKAVRKGVAPAFSTANVRKGFEQTLQVVDKLIRVLEFIGPQRPVDLDNAGQRESLDVIGRTGFDTDFNAVTSLASDSGANTTLDALHGGIKEGMARAIDPLRFLKLYRKDVRSGVKACKVYHEVIRDLAEKMRNGRPSADSIAAHLLLVEDPKTGRPLSDDALEAEIAIMFLAGFETTGHTIGNAMLMISQHPDVEARVLDELDSLGLLVTPQRPVPRQMEWEDLVRMPYLSCAIKETMRILPVSSDGTLRVSPRDLKLGPHTIPAGVTMWMPFMSTFNHPEQWEDPTRYQPDRWLSPDAEFGLHPNTINAGAKSKRFFPFSQGPRNCVGRGLAYMNYTTTVAKLFAHFTFRLADEMGGPNTMRVNEYMNLTLHHAQGVKMHCVARSRMF